MSAASLFEVLLVESLCSVFLQSFAVAMVTAASVVQHNPGSMLGAYVVQHNTGRILCLRLLIGAQAQTPMAYLFH